MSVGKTPANEYVLGADEDERARLLAHAEIHREEAELLLDRVGIGAGAPVLDVGCGPIGVLDVLSRRVGPRGEVVGLDNEPRMIEYAQRTIGELKLANVQLVSGDATSTELADDSFDLAHERLVLTHQPDPSAIVAEMVRVVRPGGWVAVQEGDAQRWWCEPQHPAWEELHAALSNTWSGDFSVGRRLPALLRDAGLGEVEVDAHAHVWGAGHPYQTLLLTFTASYRDRILGRGLLSEDRLNALIGELEEHLARPEVFVIHPLLFQAWGRKPT